MWLRQRWEAQGAATLRCCELLLLAIVLIAKPQDWRGSRYGESASIPNENWWQYRCQVPKCEAFLQFEEKPNYRVVCEEHKAIMKLAHDPTKG